jgi:molecular chaperone GrpE
MPESDDPIDLSAVPAEADGPGGPADAEAAKEGEALPPDPEAMAAEIADLRDRLLRALAEAENARKRGERDRRDAEVYGGTRLARDLLSVHDNLGRALEAITEDLRATAGPLIEGLELTQRDLLATFARHRITRLDPGPGEMFDPRLHQAMFEAPVPGTSKGEIIQLMSAGFMIGERLLRPAQVGVSSSPARRPEPASAAGPEAGGDNE